jgi:hypothetical protein
MAEGEVMNLDIGHFRAQQARLRRFHAAQRARGMSDTALRRLPAVALPSELIELTPVIATKRHATNYDQQAKARKSQLDAKREREAFSAVAKKIRLPDQSVGWYRGPTKSTQTVRAKAIAAVVAKVAGIDIGQLLYGGNKHRFARARHIAIVIVGNLTEMGRARAAQVFGLEDGSTARYAAQRVAFFLERGDAETVRIYEGSLREIKARWPEYQKEAQ